MVRSVTAAGCSWARGEPASLIRKTLGSYLVAGRSYEIMADAQGLGMVRAARTAAACPAGGDDPVNQFHVGSDEKRVQVGDHEDFRG